MNSTDAIRLMVRHYPGGKEAVALRLGKSPHTLEKELRGGESNHKLGLADACHISAMCIEVGSPHCRAYVNAVAGDCGGFVEIEHDQTASTGNLRLDLAGLLKEATDALSVITTGLADEVISDNDRRLAERELSEVIAKVQVVLAGVRAVHLASKPVSLRSPA